MFNIDTQEEQLSTFHNPIYSVSVATQEWHLLPFGFSTDILFNTWSMFAIPTYMPRV